MNLSRKDFLRSSLVLGGGLFLPTNVFGKFTNLLIEDSNFSVIRNNVGIFTGGGGTIGWYVDSDAAIVIDSQDPEHAEKFHNKLKTKSTRKIDILFNTHHHGDHTAGNYYLKDYVEKIVAQKNCPKLQKERNAKRDGGEFQVYANETFDKNWSVDFGKEKIEAYHWHNAHTGGDAVYHFVNNNVVHIGDIVFNSVYPYIDIDAGCNLKMWASYIDKILSTFNDDTIYIYGHGKDHKNSYGDKKSLLHMKEYLLALRDFSEKAVKDGMTSEEFEKSTNIPGDKNRTELWPGAKKQNLAWGYRDAKEN